ncbi:MAG: tRNA (adenosine(37)-N6)-threonylcarbamoyltransferase complex ATPase subunit type 1 TsaE [Fibrobacter sp.]|nr:tRNA (adenosine(37)-N6)-threonylcarbamoyltransferase complex ATPase subunit type 1 TsaE [Fibrobacter sp.]
MVYHTSSVEETRRLGALVAATAQSGDVYALEGDLGTGKTEFVRGFMASTGVSSVRSPSFSILNIYETSKWPVYHFDFYRLAESSELENIGFQEYISTNGVCLIEWANMFTDVLPAYTKIIKFTDEGIDKRKIEISE